METSTLVLAILFFFLGFILAFFSNWFFAFLLLLSVFGLPFEYAYLIYLASTKGGLSWYIWLIPILIVLGVAFIWYSPVHLIIAGITNELLDRLGIRSAVLRLLFEGYITWVKLSYWEVIVYLDYAFWWLFGPVIGGFCFLAGAYLLNWGFTVGLILAGVIWLLGIIIGRTTSYSTWISFVAGLEESEENKKEMEKNYDIPTLVRSFAEDDDDYDYGSFRSRRRRTRRKAIDYYDDDE